MDGRIERFSKNFFKIIKTLVVILNIWILHLMVFSYFGIKSQNKKEKLIVVGIIIIAVLVYEFIRKVNKIFKDKGKYVWVSGLFVFLIFLGDWILKQLLFLVEQGHFIYDDFYGSYGIEYGKFIILISILSVVATIILYKIGSFYKTRWFYSTNLIGLYVMWFSGGVKSVEKYLVFIAVIWIALYIISRAEKNGDDITREECFGILGTLIKISIIMLILIAIVPKGMYGHRLFGLENLFSNEYGPGKGSAVKYSDVYRFSDATDGGMKKLGGKIKQKDTVLFEVTGKYKEYLKASSRTYYDGEYWYNSKVSYKKINSKGTLRDGYQGYIVEEGENTEVIYYNKMDTKTVLIPCNATKVYLDGGIYYSPESDSVLKKNDMTRMYTIKNVDLYDENSGLRVGDTFYDFGKKGRTLFKYEPVDFANEEEWKENIPEEYHKYLHLGESVSQETKDLTYEIIEEDDDVYTRVYKIRKYLRESFPYTLEVEEVPQGSDFVHYFLFQEQKGYCTYFASAMGIMSRIAGVPSRYCEGFKVDETRTVERRWDGQTWAVSEKNAHAWVEVLVDPENDVWIPVEATSPEEGDVVREQEEEVEKEKEDDININRDGYMNHKGQLQFDETDFGGGAEVETKRLPWEVLLISIFGALLIYIILILGRNLKVRRSNKPKIIFDYALRKFKWIKIEKRKEETELEFALRLDEEEIREVISELVKKGYAMSYGESIQYSSKDDYDKINEYLKIKCKGYKYLIIRYLVY